MVVIHQCNRSSDIRKILDWYEEFDSADNFADNVRLFNSLHAMKVFDEICMEMTKLALCQYVGLFTYEKGLIATKTYKNKF